MVLAALDRVAKTQEPEQLGVFCTTDSLVAAAAAARRSASGLLAELGDVLGAAARASTAICRRARRTSALRRDYPLELMRETAGRISGRKALALVVLLIAAWILFKVVIGVVAAARWIVVVVLAVVAIVWAHPRALSAARWSA